MVLSGGTSRIAGLAEALADRFDTKVEAVDPFRRIAIESSAIRNEHRAEMGPIAAVAVGLAMRRADDR